VIFAYGLDRAGFTTPTEPLETEDLRVEWIPYASPQSLDDADAVVFPSGIFETISYHPSYLGAKVGTVKTDREMLLARERQVANILRKGGWACVLVSEIIDKLPDDHGRMHPTGDTDLAKRLLTGIGIERVQVPEGTGYVAAKRDEFREYIRRWGVARTLFSGPRLNKRLAVVGDSVAGFEVSERLFFLPFHTTTRSAQEAREVASIVVDSILDYRRKVTVEVPEWARSLQFQEEARLLEEQGRLQEKLMEVESGIALWEERKAILVTSGENLKSRVVEILKSFFGLDVDPLDEGREDFKVISRGEIVSVGESKGTNSGIKREYINQVDSHRERLGFGVDVPGVLIINNQMDVSSVEGRLATQIAPEQVAHARRLNVAIMRTIDLLYLMRHLENDAVRGAKLLQLIRSGGGWLCADQANYRLITG